jgi:hypothetical protein
VSGFTAHAVRLSRGFLLENPRVAGPTDSTSIPRCSTAIRAMASCTPMAVVLVGGRDLTINVLAGSGDDDDPPRKLAARLAQPDLARLVASARGRRASAGALRSTPTTRSEPDAARRAVRARAARAGR